MNLEYSIIFVFISIAAVYMFRYLQKEINSAKNGRCSGCPLAKSCAVKQNAINSCDFPLFTPAKRLDHHHISENN